MRKNALIGKRITAVYIADDKEALKFDVEGGEPIVARVDANCCSQTWVETVETPEHLLGTVTAVENIDMPDLGSPSDYDVIAYYGCKIHTEKGSCLIDYRNSSNGFYGGLLCWPGESFYVYGQAISSVFSGGKWEKLA
jgi:hypothetical protein